MARNEQLIRQHKVLQILERTRFGRTLEEIRDDLVQELGLSSLHVRTLRRDLEALAAAGFDVTSVEQERGRVWKLGPRYKGAHTVTATTTELMALSLGRDLLFPLAGTPFWSGIESFWHKMREALPPAVTKHFDKYRGVLYVLGMPAKSYEKQQGILSTMNRAILQHRVVEIEYESLTNSNTTPRSIYPYAIVFYQSSLYIIADAAESAGTGALRHWKLDRFRKARALDEWFTPRNDIDMGDYLQRGIGIFAGQKLQQFRIWISAYAARWVLEDPWHPDQKVEREADGSILLTVPAVHELEVIPRVLALGSEAELLSPGESRQTMAKIVENLHRKYHGETP